MAHTFEELKSKTAAQLQEIAEGIEHDAVHGYTTMHKEQLVHAICTALDIEEHAHHDVVGIDKRAIKTQIRELKAQRDAALEAHDHATLKLVRRKIRRLRRKIRAATV
jgi:DNA-binding ferritin-like protein